MIDRRSFIKGLLTTVGVAALPGWLRDDVRGLYVPSLESNGLVVELNEVQAMLYKFYMPGTITDLNTRTPVFAAVPWPASKLENYTAWEIST